MMLFTIGTNLTSITTGTQGFNFNAGGWVTNLWERPLAIKSPPWARWFDVFRSFARVLLDVAPTLVRRPSHRAQERSNHLDRRRQKNRRLVQRLRRELAC